MALSFLYNDGALFLNVNPMRGYSQCAFGATKPKHNASECAMGLWITSPSILFSSRASCTVEKLVATPFRRNTPLSFPLFFGPVLAVEGRDRGSADCAAIIIIIIISLKVDR